MTDAVITELMILAMVLIVNIRVFFVSRGKKDLLVILSPLALLVNLLMFFAWGIELFSSILFVFCVLVLLENLRSLWRLANGLLIDFYSPWLWVASVINILLILAIGFCVIVFRPATYYDKLQVQKDVTFLAGSEITGLRVREKFEVPSVVVSRIYPSDKNKEDLPIVIYVTDPRTTCRRAETWASKIADYGYEVIVADYNVNVFSSLINRWKGVKKPEEFTVKNSKLSYKRLMEYKAVIKMLEETETQNRPVFLLGDGLKENELSLCMQQSTLVQGFVYINGKDSLGDFHILTDWEEGFGPVKEHAPWMDFILHPGKELKRQDFQCTAGRELASQCNDFFKTVIQNKL